MIKCIIVDDEKKAIRVIENFLEHLKHIKIVGKFSNAIDALSFLYSNEVDIMFLDINMPEVTGLEMLASLENPPKVILTTAYSEYALDGYQYGVVDYLLKPFSLQRFLKAVNRVLLNKNDVNNKIEKNYNNTLLIKQNDTLYPIKINTILYIKAYGNYVKIITETSKYIIREKLHEIEHKLPKYDFIRVHKSFIVSLSQIDVIKGNTIFIKNNEIQIGLYYKSMFIEMMKKM